MAPFQYDRYRDPYVGTAAELMLRRGDIDAQRALHVGDVQARSTEQQGQLWGGAVQQIGQSVAALPGQVQVQKRIAQQDELAGLQISEQKRSIQLRAALSQAITQTPMVEEGGLSVYDIPAITKNLPPEFRANADEVVKRLGGINDAFRAELAAKRTLVVQGATSLLAAGSDPGLTLHFLDVLEKNRSWPKSDLDVFRQVISTNPQQTEKVLRQFVPPQKMEVVGEGGTGFDPITHTPVVQGAPKAPTEATLALEAAGGDAAGAMAILKPKPKLSIEEEWVARDRRLAVAKNGGRPLDDAQLRTVDAASLQGYKESNADPDLRAAALAQKNIALALANAQMGLMPTKEQALDVANDLVNHRIAPEQLASLFSTRGKEGMAFKLAVASEARKMDPTFNWEEASAVYGLVKGAAFQNTIRYMDSVLESMPRLQENATKLGNGRFRTWTEVVNATKNQFSDTDLKRFKTDAVLVGDEVAKIISGGGTGSATSDAKLKQGMDLIGQADSVPAIAAALEEITVLIGNRRKSLTRGTYMEGTGAVKPLAPKPKRTNPFGVSGG